MDEVKQASFRNSAGDQGVGGYRLPLRSRVDGKMKGVPDAPCGYLIVSGVSGGCQHCGQVTGGSAGVDPTGLLI